MSYFSWAPVFNSYGSNNRTNSVRVPMGGGRCESRNADGAVNPYLAATLALAAGLEGIRDKIDPGDPNEDNLYTISEAERRARNIDFLPQTLQEAVAAFAADPLIEADARQGAARRIRQVQDDGMGKLPSDRQPMGNRTLQPSVLTRGLSFIAGQQQKGEH